MVDNSSLDKPVEKAPMSDKQFLKLLWLQIGLANTCVILLMSLQRLDILQNVRIFADYFSNIQYVDVFNRSRPGWLDAFFIVKAFVLFILLRSGFQMACYQFLVVVKPQLTTKSKIRFTEQAWYAVFYTTTTLWGLKLLENEPYSFFNPQQMWEGYPHYYISVDVKRYYLSIFACWLAQILIIHLEEKRKDHYQMLTHHIVTCTLVLGSYIYSYTRIGHLVMIMMDSVDIFLAVAKCTKYLKWGWITDAIFIVFLISWIVLRHFVYMYQMLYGAFPATKLLEGKCVYEMGAPVQCFSYKAHYFFFALTMALQVITLMWLVLIIRVVIRVVKGDGAADSRSDSSD